MLSTHMWLTAKGNAGAEITITGSPGDVHTFMIPERCVVVRAGFIASTAVASSGASVIEFDRVPNTGGSREACFAQITIPAAGLAVRKGYYDEPATRKVLYPMDLVVVQIATSPSATGKGYPYLIVEAEPDLPVNEAQLTKSA